jgi:hypothetical protein
MKSGRTLIRPPWITSALPIASLCAVGQLLPAAVALPTGLAALALAALVPGALDATLLRALVGLLAGLAALLGLATAIALAAGLAAAVLPSLVPAATLAALLLVRHNAFLRVERAAGLMPGW